MMKTIDNDFCRPNNPLFLTEEDGFYRLSIINNNSKANIFETRWKEEIQSILNIIPEHSEKGNKMWNLLLEHKDKTININKEYSLYFSVNNLSHISLLYKQENIANRCILLAPLLQTYLTKEVAINGHGGIINPEMIGKGHGFKLYQYIDEFIGLPSVPSNAPGVFGLTSEQALKVFSRLKKYRMENNLIHPEVKVSPEEVEHYTGMHKYLRNSGLPKDSLGDYLERMDDIFVYKDIDSVVENIAKEIEFYRNNVEHNELEDILKEFCKIKLPDCGQKYYLKEYHDIILTPQQINDVFNEIYTKAFKKAGLKYNNKYEDYTFM